MSVFWLFVLVFANAWTLGLYILPRLRRQSTGLNTLFVGAAVGAANFAVGGAIHARTMADHPTMSLAVVFGVRLLLHTFILIGFYRRPTGRGAKVNQWAKWGAAALGGLYFATIGLMIELYVQVTEGWPVEGLYFDPGAVLNAVM